LQNTVTTADKLVTEHRHKNFHHQIWYHMVSLCRACIQSLGIILTQYSTFVPNYVSFAASTVELAHEEK